MRQLQIEQFALSNYHYIRYSFSYFIKSVKRFDIRKIELYAAEPHLCIPDTSNDDVAAMGEALRQAGLQVCCLTQEQCLYPVNIASGNPATRARSIDSFVRCIEVAVQLDCPKVLVTPGWDVLDTEPAAWERSAEALMRLCDKAQHYGVRIVLEGVTRLSTNVATSAADIVRLMEQVRHPALTSMVDVCVLAREGLSFEQECRLLGNRLEHIHLADLSGFSRYALGDGELPIESHLDYLDSLGYEGDIALEIMNRQYDEDPHSCTARCVDYINTWLRCVSAVEPTRGEKE